MITLQKQVPYPAFIERNGQVLVRKLYEYRIVDGKLIVVDLPLPGQQPEYMNEQQQRLWHEQNKKILNEFKR